MREIVNIILLILLIIGGPVALFWCMYFEDADELMKKQDINDKAQQKQALIDMMCGVGKEKQTCKNCKFNNELYCTVGTHYAEKGLNKICYEGELWEGKYGYE